MFLFSNYRLNHVLLLLIIGSSLLSACSDTDNGKKGRNKPAHLVETTQTKYQQVSTVRTLSGTLQAIREVKIINQANGLLKQLPVYQGDLVKAGDTLAQLDDSLIKAEVAKARATLKQSKVDLKRLKDLAPRKMASESEIAQAQTQVDIAASELQLKQAELEYSHILAPIDGVISNRLAETGDVIPMHSHLLTLLDTSSLKAEIHLSELLLPLVETGNKVDIKIDALGDQVFAGSIVRVFPSIDKNTRRGTIEIKLHPVPDGARAGQLCRVTIYTQARRRLMIPYQAVRHDKNGSHVYIIDNNAATRTNINTGIQQDQMIEVLDGLNENQEVIIKGFFGLKDKMQVKKTQKPQDPKSNKAETS